ncbi:MULTISPECIES: antirestriction protein ArdA [Eubacteriales]|uniref:Antirestriction protein ArdA n=3 Tax=Flavonifractor plautii TaxID=292800 RepID=A0A6N3H506_FLAPL|nr:MULTISPECIES: antirestriction protein ArdA [Eubacteriales]MCB7043708.1 antirestriction protein ArdA [Flavonifractor plautii]MCG4708768.1 antirestriction protein ArdA [Flavonifractor plautii]MCQ5312523.1 antirestriction protein ArdA [Flavonifractor plautii]MDB7888678.1 antirestriction protein ArdA [Flavonifractor plautii]MDB7906045.1 antirestriction protein ArdA [Flavonifractor plautii]
MDKAFTVSLCNPDKDTYVTLELPADPYAVLDAWERLRLAPDTRVEWEMEDYGEFPVLFPGLQSGEGFPALNALAERLTSLDSRQRTAFEGLVKLQDGRPMEPDALITLSEQAKHCQVAPEATDDASLGRVYAANGSIPEVKDVPDKVFELLDFQLLGRRIRQSAGGVFTRQGYVVPDGNWKPTEGQELRIAPEAPTGFFRLELRLGEERAELTLPAGQELVEVRERMEAVGLPNCAVTAFHSRVPQLPAAWATPERLDTLNCLAIRLMVLAERDSLALIKYKAVLEVSSISSLEDAMALTERLDAYNLNWAAASPEDVARGELRRSMGEENADLLCWYLNLYGYGEALIQQYGGELTDYGLLTRADGQPVQKPLPPQPTRGGVQMEMR